MTEELTPDDIKVGDWFAITETSISTQESNPYVQLQFVPDGVPWRVTAVSLPFILATDDTRHTSFYLPLFRLRRVTKRYVTLFQEKVAPYRKGCHHG